MRVRGGAVSGLVAVCAVLLTACSSAPRPAYTPPVTRPLEVLRVERGEIIAVNDVRIEPTSARRVVATSSEAKTPAGPSPMVRRSPRLLGIPVGTGPHLIPGEEITVRLNNGQLMMIVQEQSSPAFAKGERVRVITEQQEMGLGSPLTRVERDL